MSKRSTSIWTVGWIALTVLLFASLVVGCQPTATPTVEKPVETEEEKAPEPTAVPPTEPVVEEKKVLTVAASAEITSFDSGAGGDFPNYALNLLMFDNLLQQDENGVPQPMLAEFYSVAEDNVTWTFNLKQGIEFSDGTPFTSEAVCFTVDALIAEDATKTHASTWRPVDECKVVDDYTVQIITADPYAPMISRIISGGFAGQILSPSMGEFGEDMGLNPIGTGPYKLKEWIRGDRVVLERNENYSEVLGPPAYFDEIVWLIVPEDTTRMLMLEAGEVDFAYKVPAERVADLSQNPDITISSVPGLWQWYLINVLKPPFDDVRVRQAVNYAVDKQTIVDTLLYGRAVIAEGSVGSAFDGFYPAGAYEYDPDKAVELLEAAGAMGASFDVHAPSGRYPSDSTVAEAVVGQLQSIGLNAELVVIGDWPAYMETIWTDDPMLTFLGWQPTDASAFFLRTALCDGGNWNLGPYCDPEVDELINQASSILDPEARKEVLDELQARIFEEAQGLFMYNVALDFGMRKNLGGVYIQPNSLVHFDNAHYIE